MTGVDAHVHLWNRTTDPQPWIDPVGMSAIDRDFGPAELAGMLDAEGIGSAVVVQAANSAGETERLLDLAASPGGSRIAGVVGWLDLTADIDDQLDRLEPDRRARLRGVRHLVHLEEDGDWVARPDVGRALDRLGAHDLGFDLVLRPWQLELAAQVADAHRATRFALDHLGGLVESVNDAEWQRGLLRIAECGNVSAKISGLARLADEPDRRRRAVDTALDAFGPSRLMYGSDWPMAQLGPGGVSAWRDDVLAMIEPLSAGERHDILGRNAADHYRLELT